MSRPGPGDAGGRRAVPAARNRFDSPAGRPTVPRLTGVEAYAGGRRAVPAARNRFDSPAGRPTVPRLTLRLLAIGLALSLALSGCGGGEEEGGDAASSPGTSPAATAAAPGVLELSPVPRPSPAPPASRAPAPPRDRTAPAAPPPGGPKPAGPPLPAQAGTYTFTETGSTKVRGCLTGDQPVPSPTRLVVGPPAGNRQHFERDQRDPLGMGSFTAADVEYRPDGIYLVFLRQTQTLVLSSAPTEFEPNPPVLILPAGGEVGRSWAFSTTSRDGKVRVDTQNRLEAAGEQVRPGGGQAVEAVRVLSTSRISGQSPQGSLDLNRSATTWYAPQTGLPVKESTTTTGRIGLCEVDSRIEATMQ